MVLFGTLPDGTAIHEVTLGQASGVELRVITYGGIISALKVPDARREVANVVLAHDTLCGYLDDRNYLGALIGRYGNRIANGRFSLDGARYQLDRNDGPNHLHGGHAGYNRRVWNVDEITGTAVTLSLVDPAGACGYPGTLTTTVTIVLSEHNALRIDYRAATDRPTIVNLTQHSYFNLTGDPTRTIDDHLLRVDARGYTPVNGELIPTGELKDVRRTPLDFRSERRIGESVYDHNFVLDGQAGDLRVVARLADPVSGRSMDVLTTEPGLQFYSGHLLEVPRTGLCLETQHFPDSPNHPAFPPTVLRPGEHYTSTTIYRFGV
jgi:aldose 1-epimerase